MTVTQSGASVADSEEAPDSEGAPTRSERSGSADLIEPSGTPALLLRLIVVLTLATALAGGASLTVFAGSHAAVAGIGGHAAPAVFEVEAARAALADADRLAVTTLSAVSGPGRLSGPGSQYHDDIAVASQSLDQLAADNVAGADASQLLQTIEGLEATYTALVEQADAGYHQQDVGGLGLANLWYASELMNSTTGGGSILSDLDKLRTDEQNALNARWSSAGNGPAPVAAALAADLIVLGALVATQLAIRRRFRRALNIRLLAASVLVLLIAGVTGSALISRQEIADVQHGTYADVLDAYGQEINALRSQAQPVLAEEICGAIRYPNAPCAPTLQAAIDLYKSQMTADSSSVRTPTTDKGRLATEAAAAQTIAGGREHYATAAAAAAADFGPLVATAVSSLGVALILVPWGLWSRLSEYRYRSR